MLPELLVAMAMSAANVAQVEQAGNFLALGDSYTIGEGVAENERWPLQLTTALHARGITLTAPQIIARTGWTTDELTAAINSASLHPPYALVTLLIGVNNQYRGRDRENYREEFSALLVRAIHLAAERPQHVIVLSIPDWGVTRFGHESGRDVQQIANEIDAYNAINREVSDKLHVRYIDITPTTRIAGMQSDMLTADGLHPSAAMYSRWVALTLDAAQAVLSSN